MHATRTDVSTTGGVVTFGKRALAVELVTVWTDAAVLMGGVVATAGNA